MPEGIEFIEPVTLILKYTDEEIEGSKEEDLFITTRGKNNELLISLLSDVDTIANTITTEINHFSKWGMCTRLKVKLVPEEKTLNKGQTVDMEVQRWEIMPVDIEKKEALLKELYEKEKKYEEAGKKEYNEFINSLVSQKQTRDDSKYTPASKIDALGDKLIALRKRTSLIVKKIVDGAVNKEMELDKIKKELGLPIDDLLNVLEVKKTIEATKLSIIDWKLNNTKAPVSNSFGTLTPKESNAKYTAPKIVSDKNKNVIVTVTVMGKEESGETFKFKLHSNITLTDEYYLNYTFDGKTTNTLQFAISPTFIKNMQQNAEKVMEQPISQCFLVDNELIIGTMSKLNLAENLNTTDVVYFKIKNPTKGQNFIKCDDESSSFRNDTRISVQTGVKDEHFVNSQNLRWWSGNMCDGKDNCVPFEFNITEYNPLNGGIVSGSFSGKVYEDKDMAKKCSNSIEHFISGEFSLAIQITPEDETEIKVPASKPTTTNSSTKPKSKTPPPPPPPLTPEEIAKMDGTPPKAPPPLTPEEIAKMDGTPPKAPPPLTPEEIAKMDGTPPKAPPPLTPEEIAKMDGTPPKAPPPLTPEEIAKMDGTPPKAPPPLTPEEIAKMDGTPPKAPPPLTPAEIAKMDGTPPKAPPPLTPAEIAKMDGTNSSSAKSAATAVNTSSSSPNSKTISLKKGTAGVSSAISKNATAGNAILYTKIKLQVLAMHLRHQNQTKEQLVHLIHHLNLQQVLEMHLQHQNQTKVQAMQLQPLNQTKEQLVHLIHQNLQKVKATHHQRLNQMPVQETQVLHLNQMKVQLVFLLHQNLQQVQAMQVLHQNQKKVQAIHLQHQNLMLVQETHLLHLNQTKVLQMQLVQVTPSHQNLQQMHTQCHVLKHQSLKYLLIVRNESCQNTMEMEKQK